MDRINAARKQTVPESGNSAGIPRGAVRYEAVFLDNDEVDAMLRASAATRRIPGIPATFISPRFSRRNRMREPCTAKRPRPGSSGIKHAKSQMRRETPPATKA